MNRNLDYIINLIDGNFQRGMNAAVNRTDALDHKFMNLVKTVGLAFGARELYTFGKDAVMLSSKVEAMDIRMQAASRTAQAYGVNNAFLKKTIEDLKLPLMETTEGYSKFLGGIRGTSLEGEKGNKVFRDMAIGIKALKLDPEASGRSLNALTKMISTGTVQADEFKGQLAEAMPGAVELGAKAMGMSMQQFYKQMEKGNIKSAEFVQKFAQQLVNEYGSTIPNALESTQSKLTAADNAFQNSTRTLGDALAPAFIAVKEGVAGLAEATARLIAGQTPLADKLRETQLYLNAEFEMLKKGNITLDQRKILIDQINASASPYLKNLLTEKSTIQEITAAQALMNSELSKKIQIQAKNELMGDVIKQAVMFRKEELNQRIKASTQFDKGNLKRGAANMLLSKHFSNAAEGKEKELRNIDEILNKTLSGMGIKMNTAVNNVPEGAPFPPSPFKSNGKTDNVGSALIDSSKTSTAAGRSVRNINVEINNLVGEFNINTTNVKEGAQSTKKFVQDALVRSVMDAEAAL